MEVLDNFGNLFKGAKVITVSLVSIDGKDSRDITKNAKISKSNNSASITLNEKEVGKYRL